MTNQSGQTATFGTLTNLAILHNSLAFTEETATSKNPEPLRPLPDDLWPDGTNGGTNGDMNGGTNGG